jgi:hypothetical protein
MSITPKQAVRGLKALFPTSVFGRDVVVNVLHNKITSIVSPQPVTEQQIIDASMLPIEISQAECIKAAEKHVLKWFTPLGVSALQDKLLEKKEAGTLDDYPKLVAVYTWMKTIQATALSGGTAFPDPPHTFDEVLAE